MQLIVFLHMNPRQSYKLQNFYRWNSIDWVDGQHFDRDLA